MLSAKGEGMVSESQGCCHTHPVFGRRLGQVRGRTHELIGFSGEQGDHASQ